jgi:hypothetical protein
MTKEVDFDERDFGIAVGSLGILLFILWGSVGFLIAVAVGFAVLIALLKHRSTVLLLYLIWPLAWGVVASVLIMVGVDSDPSFKEASALTKKIVGVIVLTAPTVFLYWLVWDKIKFVCAKLRNG